MVLSRFGKQEDSALIRRFLKYPGYQEFTEKAEAGMVVTSRRFSGRRQAYDVLKGRGEEVVEPLLGSYSSAKDGGR